MVEHWSEKPGVVSSILTLGKVVLNKTRPRMRARFILQNMPFDLNPFSVNKSGFYIKGGIKDDKVRRRAVFNFMVF